MAISAETKDCTALSDTELEEMANLSVDTPAGFDIGLISKQKDAWVLVSIVRDNNKMVGFTFYTLERLGGTPCMLIGCQAVKRTNKRDAALRGLQSEQYHKMLMAFPDEDVVVGTRFIQSDGYLTYKGLDDIVPRPGYKPTGEERAWVRRLAKRFGYENSVDDQNSIITGDGSPQPILDYETLKPETIDKELEQFVKPLNPKRHDTLVVFGWAMAEPLAAQKLGI
jgi:hypothetical protein